MTEPVSQMGPGWVVFIMMSNYFHDVATAMFAASGVFARLLLRRAHAHTDPAAREFASRSIDGVKALARFSLWWILLGGIPRVITYRGFEWGNAVAHGQVPALIVKHVLATVFVALGIYLWAKSRAGIEALAPKR